MLGVLVKHFTAYFDGMICIHFKKQNRQKTPVEFVLKLSFLVSYNVLVWKWIICNLVLRYFGLCVFFFRCESVRHNRIKYEGEKVQFIYVCNGFNMKLVSGSKEVSYCFLGDFILKRKKKICDARYFLWDLHSFAGRFGWEKKPGGYGILNCKWLSKYNGIFNFYIQSFMTL